MRARGLLTEVLELVKRACRVSAVRTNHDGRVLERLAMDRTDGPLHGLPYQPNRATAEPMGTRLRGLGIGAQIRLISR